MGPSAPPSSPRAPEAARMMTRAGAQPKAPLVGNPHLGRDLRRIAMVTAALLVLLITLWLVLR